MELLKAEAAKVAEAQQALVEADQQRGQLADDKGRLEAEVEHLRGQVTTAEGPMRTKPAAARRPRRRPKTRTPS